MENIITQRFVYAQINPYRNYCKLEDKNQYVKSDRDEYFWSHSDIYGYQLPKNIKKNIFFFKSNDEDRINLKRYTKKNNNIFETTKDNQIKRHYGNPFSDIKIRIIERTIVKKQNKVTIKLYVGTKHRSLNCVFFKKSFYVRSITFNIETGDFTISKIDKSGKTSQRYCRKNSFSQLYNFLRDSNPIIMPKLFDKNSNLFVQHTKIFDDKIFINEVIRILGFNSYHEKIKIYDGKIFEEDLVRKFIEIKKIKVPDGDFFYWMKNFYPTEKYFKKNDRKLYASVLDMLGIKSKSTIKILHKYPTIDIVGIYSFCKMMGESYHLYLGNIKSHILSNTYRNKDDGTNKYNLKELCHDIFLRESEKECLIKLINNSRIPSLLNGQNLQYLIDHFKMINKIRKYDDTVEMKSKTDEQFKTEHQELSKMVAAIKKGWVIEYIYDEKTINEIEIPYEIMFNVGTIEEPVWGIDLDNKNYLYPVILKREEEYIEEGNFMHHCVASYADKDKSIIVSIRTLDSINRVTCEYDIQTGRCLQERFFCNGTPPKEFEYALAKVGEKIKQLARWGILKWKEKKEVPLKINGKEIEIKPRRAEDFLFDL